MRIAQVIRNILDNAIKYGNQHDIIVTIENISFSSISKRSINGIKISVTDHGIGIPKNELEHIFTPFSESSRTKSIAGGTGLGLAICNSIIIAHNGRIKANSNKKTTTISFILPIIQNQPNGKKIKTSISHHKIINILVVDDDYICLKTCSMILTNLGYNTVTAINGKEALDILKKQDNKIDAILLDIMMPDIYGINLLKKIKSIHKLSHIPIMIQSGLLDKEEIDKAYALGAVGFIAKPYNKNSINDILESIYYL
ncbi:Autoinducer 2 sensor kinase/phosphatase LuxQ [Rickettsia endosymbiont of Cardiosporidium cionae]|nr:Autoinducer 2 sensor kinase/phosphatase LuxQ [Rickettsia endosymbiont of Cardiosporidium cionae]